MRNTSDEAIIDRKILIELLTDHCFDPENLADHLLNNGITIQSWARWSSPDFDNKSYRLCSGCYTPEGTSDNYCSECGARMNLE